MNTSSKYDIPWELITESLTGKLPAEGELRLKQWLSYDPANKEKYSLIQELWKDKMEDYKFYKLANEKEGWNALQRKIGKKDLWSGEANIIRERPAQKIRALRNFIAIAAFFLGLIGIGFWFAHIRSKPVIYETAANTHRKIILHDGSAVTLEPLTRIEVSHDYNTNTRNIFMVSGEAYFEVRHMQDKPFVVEMGSTQVKDMGTSFTIRKGEKEIKVTVSSGKVAFVKTSTSESKELSASTSLTFDVGNEKFGEIKKLKSTEAYKQLMNFENTPLSEIIDVVRKVYGKKIVLSNDEQLADKKMTAHLEGMPYSTVLKIICKSLGLEYTLSDSIYILKEKK